MKLLVIGIDGGSWDVFDPRLAAGDMPNVAGLLEGSMAGDTDSTWPAHTGPGWPTLVTGTPPGVHGVFSFFESQTPAYGMEVVSASRWADRSLLNHLARQGYAVASVNIPMSHPPSGLLRAELTWPLTETTRFASPRSLTAELLAAGAPFTPDLHTMYRGQDDYLQTAIANVAARLETARYVCRKEVDLDVLAVVLTEFDRVAHHLWEDDPYGMPGGAPVTEICRAMDRSIGALIDEAGECDVLLVSDHGFGPSGPSLSLNTHLADVGWLRTSSRERAATDAPWFGGERGSIDWIATSAFAPTPGGWGVNLNIAGRQRDGTIRRNDAKAASRDLCEILVSLKGPAGAPALRAVLATREIYPGLGADLGPDLLLIPVDERYGMNCDLNGDVWVRNPQRANHRFTGMWSLRSASCTPSASEHVALSDVLPLALEAAGLDGDLPRPASRCALADLGRTDPTPRLRQSQADRAVVADPSAPDLVDTLKRMGYL